MKDTSRFRAAATGRVSNPVRFNIGGAPFRIGQAVLVCQLVDETATTQFLGMKGVVEHLEYSCGCGQGYPHDPMIGVRFRSGDLEEFWREELVVVGPN